MKHISQIISESQDPTIVDLTSKKPTYICDDCMHGHHEVAGNTTCQCVCHGNPQCFVCGLVLIDAKDISEGVHLSVCQDLYEQQCEERRAEPFGRYPWER